MIAHISKSSEIGENTSFGINAIVMDDVKIGSDCMIGNNVIIYPGTQIGDNVRIDDNSIIGKKPLSSPRSIFKVDDSLQPAIIGDQCQIGAMVTIYVQAKIGANNLIADLATVR